ncbi:MAG: response regulator [Candidatus Competibacteraceae bacterium]
MLSEAVPEILIVDDSPVDLKRLTDMLAERGYRVRPATSGSLALRSVATKAPDLVLMDVRITDMDGYSVCQRLKTDPATSSIPVIFISAPCHAVDKVKCFAAGGADYITKPFAPEEVLARVRTHVELGHLQRTLEQRVADRTPELSRANDALRNREKRLRLVMEATDAGVWDWDLQTGEVYLNDRWYTMLDYAPGEFPPNTPPGGNGCTPTILQRWRPLFNKILKARYPDSMSNFGCAPKAATGNGSTAAAT